MPKNKFDIAVDHALVTTPSEDKHFLFESALFLRQRRLISFKLLTQHFRSLPRDALITAVRLLPHLDKQRAGSTLVSVLRWSRVPLVQLETAKTLATLDRRTTAELLISCLPREKSANVRYWMAYTIGCLGDPVACELLLGMLEDNREQVKVRSQAAEALGYILLKIGKKTNLYRRSLKTLIGMLGDSHAEIRFWTAFALGNIKAKSAVKRLDGLAKCDRAMCPGFWRVSVEAADAIRVIKGQEWPDRSPKR